MKEPLFTEENGILLARSDGCSVYQFRNVTGDGTMTCYEVFPGTMLSFNDFHMTYFDLEYIPGRERFAIDHCREGKMEYLAVENAYAYIGASDIKLDRRLTHTGQYPGVIHEKELRSIFSENCIRFLRRSGSGSGQATTVARNRMLLWPAAVILLPLRSWLLLPSFAMKCRSLRSVL